LSGIAIVTDFYSGLERVREW